MYFCSMKQILKNIILVLSIVVLLMLIGLLGSYLYRQILYTRAFAQQYTSVNASDEYAEECADQAFEFALAQ